MGINDTTTGDDTGEPAAETIPAGARNIITGHAVVERAVQVAGNIHGQITSGPEGIRIGGMNVDDSPSTGEATHQVENNG